MFHAEFRSAKIELFLFGEILCRIELDSQSEVAIVSDFRGIGMSPSEFIESIKGCQYERNEAIRAVFVHSLGRLIVESAIDNNSDVQFHLDSTLTAGYAIMYLFGLEFRQLFNMSPSKIWIALCVTNQCLHISTRQTLLQQTVREPDVQDLIQRVLWPRRVVVFC
jgi:hypothetical protein